MLIRTKPQNLIIHYKLNLSFKIILKLHSNFKILQEIDKNFSKNFFSD